MREKLIELLGREADASDETLLGDVRQLMAIARSPGAKQEKAIREKISAGLSREDAIQVLKDQAADDELRAEREEQAAEAAKAEEARKAKVAKSQGDPAKPNNP
jgi:hypothetical protein